MRDGRGRRAGLRRGDAAGVGPRVRARAACVAAGLAVEVLPGPSAAIAALVASALPADRWRFVGFPAAQARRAGRGVRLARDARGVRVARGGSPRRWRVLAELDPERPVAVCRELTKVHEEVVRGSAAELAARYADEPPRGRGRARGRRRARRRPATSGRRWRRVRRLVDAGAKPRPAASVVAELTGAQRQRAVPRADAIASELRCRSTSPPRSTTSTRSRTSATRTRRSPPTCSRATCASAARTCSS